MHCSVLLIISYVAEPTVQKCGGREDLSLAEIARVMLCKHKGRPRILLEKIP